MDMSPAGTVTGGGGAAGVDTDYDYDYEHEIHWTLDIGHLTTYNEQQTTNMKRQAGRLRYGHDLKIERE
jgi:hypothetical protein